MQVFRQVRLHGVLIFQVYFTGVGIPLELWRQRDGASDDEIARRSLIVEGRQDRVGANQVRIRAPAGGIRRVVPQEDVDEKGFAHGIFGDTDVDDPFRVGAVGLDVRRVGSACERFARAAAVKGVDGLLDGRLVRVFGLGIIVAKRGRVPGSSRIPEFSAGVSMERFQRGVGIDGVARFDGRCPVGRFYATHVTIGVYCLPDSKKTIGVCVMQPKNRIKRGVINLGPPSA